SAISRGRLGPTVIVDPRAARPPRTLCSGARAAADVNPRAVPARDFRIHPAQYEHAAIEGDDLAILRARRWTVGAHVGLAPRSALQPQLARLGVVGEMHHHAAVRPAVDDIGLIALRLRGGFGASAVAFLVIGGKPPAS